MTRPARTAQRPRLATACLSAVVASVAILGVSLAGPPPVAACSCVATDSIAEAAARPKAVIFAGTTGVPEAQGIEILVTEWFFGAGAAPVVYLSPDSFGQQSACGLGSLPTGSRWLWVGYRDRPLDPIQTGLCSFNHDLATPEGQAVLADARRVFGAGPIPTTAPSAEAAIAATSPPSASPGEGTRRTALTATAGAVLAIVAVMFGAVVLLAGRGARRAR